MIACSQNRIVSRIGFLSAVSVAHRVTDWTQIGSGRICARNGGRHHWRGTRMVRRRRRACHRRYGEREASTGSLVRLGRSPKRWHSTRRGWRRRDAHTMLMMLLLLLLVLLLVLLFWLLLLILLLRRVLLRCRGRCAIVLNRRGWRWRSIAARQVRIRRRRGWSRGRCCSWTLVAWLCGSRTCSRRSASQIRVCARNGIGNRADT